MLTLTEADILGDRNMEKLNSISASTSSTSSSSSSSSTSKTEESCNTSRRCWEMTTRNNLPLMKMACPPEMPKRQVSRTIFCIPDIDEDFEDSEDEDDDDFFTSDDDNDCCDDYKDDDEHDTNYRETQLSSSQQHQNSSRHEARASTKTSKGEPSRGIVKSQSWGHYKDFSSYCPASRQAAILFPPVIPKRQDSSPSGELLQMDNDDDIDNNSITDECCDDPAPSSSRSLPTMPLLWESNDGANVDDSDKERIASTSVTSESISSIQLKKKSQKRSQKTKRKNARLNDTLDEATAVLLSATDDVSLNTTRGEGNQAAVKEDTTIKMKKKKKGIKKRSKKFLSSSPKKGSCTASILEEILSCTDELEKSIETNRDEKSGNTSNCYESLLQKVLPMMQGGLSQKGGMA